MDIVPSNLSATELVQIFDNDDYDKIEVYSKSSQKVLQKVLATGGVLITLAVSPIVHNISIQSVRSDAISIISSVESDYNEIQGFIQEVDAINKISHFSDMILDDDTIIENELISNYMDVIKPYYANKKRPFIL